MERQDDEILRLRQRSHDLATSLQRVIWKVDTLEKFAKKCEPMLESWTSRAEQRERRYTNAEIMFAAIVTFCSAAGLIIQVVK